MILQVITLRDKVSDAYDRPSFHTAVGAAIRAFGDEVNRKESVIYAHAEDYDLYLLGTYDDATATFELLDRPRQLALGQDMKKQV